MNTLPRSADTNLHLWFKPLSNSVTGLTFPCDAEGCVDLDALCGCERLNYLYARALIGRDFERPKLRRAMSQHTP